MRANAPSDFTGQSCSQFSPRVLRLAEVIRLTGYKRASLYAKTSRHSRQFDPTFPLRINLNSSGRGAVGWLESEVIAWLQFRANERRKNSAFRADQVPTEDGNVGGGRTC